MPVDPAQAKSLFLAAVELPAAERVAFLDRECAGDPKLRARVEALLHADEPTPADVTAAFEPSLATGDYQPNEATGTFDDDTRTHEPGTGSEPGTTVGTVIAGRYSLVEVIGEGGMGSVYLASQSEPVKRQVALKLIKTGMDSKGVLARFDAERQALAMMDHPNIARIYDGGVTRSGQPFFVMELVQGVPLTEYCDAKRLTVDARLQLFVQVCQAVQHAHQKGIIHRDLKPANVLVTEVDGRPTPKVIDFGVAKATEQKLTDLSFSDVGAIVGTPAYMSPEQADPSSMDIDTRTDVYALGVILYELLTGSPPIDSKQFKRGAILEMLRMVREVDPPRPSTRLSEANSGPNIAASRSIEPAKLAKLLQGELDWVVMKALEKDRTRRYDTANGLARDIQRYLADEVVEARPPSASYRFKKFVQRNKGQVIAASLVLIALVAGVIGTTLGLLEAKTQSALAREEATAKEQARAIAVANEKLAGERLIQVEAEKARVEDEKQIAQAVRDFLRFKLLLQADVSFQADQLLKQGQASGKTKQNPTIRELLDRAAEELTESKIEANFPNQSKLQAELLNTVGLAYHGVGDFERAVEFLERAQRLILRDLGPEDATTLSHMNTLARAYLDAGKPKPALPLLEHVVKVQKATEGTDPQLALDAMLNLALAYMKLERWDRALPIRVDILKAATARYGANHPITMRSMSDLATAYQQAGEFKRAVPLFEDSLRLSKANRGAEHPETLTYMNNLALAYDVAGQLDMAITMYEETVKLFRAKLGDDHPNTMVCTANLAAAYFNANRFDQAIPLFEATLNTQEKHLGRRHPITLKTVGNLGIVNLEAGRWANALPLLEEAFGAFKEYPGQVQFFAGLIEANFQTGNAQAAIETLRKSLPEVRKILQSGSPQFQGQLSQVSTTLLAAKFFTEAEPLLRECLAHREKTEPDFWTTYNTQSLLGGALLGQKNYADAEPLLVKGYEGMKAREKAILQGRRRELRIPEALDRLIELYTATKKPDEAKKYRDLRAKYPPELAPMPKVKK